MRVVVACLSALCGLPHITAAQTAPDFVTKGAKVRVLAADGQTAWPIEGTLVQLANDTVVVAHGDSTSTIALDNRRRLEVFARTGSRAGTGTLYGAVAGLAAGFVIGWATWDLGFRAAGTGSRSEDILLLAVGGSVCGALTGRLIGSSIGTNVWTPVKTAGVRIVLTPRAVGINAAF